MNNEKMKWLQRAIVTVSAVPIVIVLFAAAATNVGLIDQFAFLDVAALLTDASLWTFTAMLACTPLHILFGWRWTLPLRRRLGLYAFMYSAVHYLIFMAGFQFNIGDGLGATLASNRLFFGFLGLALMLPLALTSSRWAMSQLGKNWKRLHYLVYAVAIFIVLHLLFLGQGALTVATYTLLLGVRIPPIRRYIVSTRQKLSSRLRTRENTATSAYPTVAETVSAQRSL